MNRIFIASIFFATLNHTHAADFRLRGIRASSISLDWMMYVNHGVAADTANPQSTRDELAHGFTYSRDSLRGNLGFPRWEFSPRFGAENLNGVHTEYEWTPALDHPRFTATYADRACVIDEVGLRCFEDSDWTPVFWNGDAQSRAAWAVRSEHWTKGPKFKSEFHNPHLVAMGKNHACAIDDDGVKCWAYPNQDASGAADVPAGIQNPRALSVGDDLSCVIDGNVAKCWGQWDYNLPENLKNPRSISVFKHDICVLDDEGVKCGGDRSYPANCCINARAPLVRQGPAISVIMGGQNLGCVRTSQGIECWRDDRTVREPDKVFRFKYPKATWVGFDQINPYNDSFTYKFYGYWSLTQNTLSQGFELQQPEYFPSYNLNDTRNVSQLPGEPESWNVLNTFELSLKTIVGDLYLPKANFARSALESLQHLTYLKGDDYQGRLFLLFALKPFINSISTQKILYMVSVYNEALLYYGRLHDVGNIRSFDQNDTNLKNAAMLLASALKNAQVYVTNAADRAQFEQLIARAGQVASEPTRRAQLVVDYTAASDSLDHARANFEISPLIQTADLLIEFMR